VKNTSGQHKKEKNKH
jgi:hypothetical protein